MERFTTKAMKKSSVEESKKTPATTATLSGCSSCEELSAQLVALERTKQGLREEAKSAKSLLELLNDPDSSDEEGEGVVVCVSNQKRRLSVCWFFWPRGPAWDCPG